MNIAFDDLSNDDKTNLFISHLSDQYHNQGKRGSQITSQVVSVRQLYLMEGIDISFLTGSKISQAIKSCRYTNEEIRMELKKKIYQQRLPFTLDMVVKAREILWEDMSWEREAANKKAVYLCIALAYDTGRRISNFTHATKNGEDHCIKINEVHFVFQPDGVTIPGGPLFRDYVAKTKDSWDADAMVHWKQVSSILLYFFTQKERCKFTITACKPIVVSRENNGQDQLVTDICQWCVHSLNNGDEELLTRNINGKQKMKRLIPAPVSKAIKNIAQAFDIDPKRISTNSLRSAYATVSGIVEENNKKANERAGWSKNSRVPRNHYAKTVLGQGALSYPECGFNVQYLNQLNPRG
jgi:hypothetical protein